MRKQNNRTKVVQRPIAVLRDELREASIALTEQLGRAVSLRTSVDLLPCPEYADELKKHRRLMAELIWMQRCRATLEVAIAKGAAQCSTSLTDTRSLVASFKRENNSVKMRIVERDIQPT